MTYHKFSFRLKKLRRSIASTSALLSILGLASCNCGNSKYALVDPLGANHVVYRIDRDLFPKEHWAHSIVERSDLESIAVVLKTRSNGLCEYICEDDIAHYIIAKKYIMDDSIDRVQYWRRIANTNLEKTEKETVPINSGF